MAIKPSDSDYICPITADSLSKSAWITFPCAHHFSKSGIEDYFRHQEFFQECVNGLLLNEKEVACPMCRRRITKVFENTEYQKLILAIDGKSELNEVEGKTLLCQITFNSMAQNAVMFMPCGHHFSQTGFEQLSEKNKHPNCPSCKKQVTGTLIDRDFQTALQELEKENEDLKINVEDSKFELVSEQQENLLAPSVSNQNKSEINELIVFEKKLEEFYQDCRKIRLENLYFEYSCTRNKFISLHCTWRSYQKSYQIPPWIQESVCNIASNLRCEVHRAFDGIKRGHWTTESFWNFMGYRDDEIQSLEWLARAIAL